MNEMKKASLARRILTPLAGVAVAASLVAGVVGTAGATSVPANVKAARAVLAKLEVRPTTLPAMPVIHKHIPHETVYFVTCGDSGPCGSEAPVVQKFANDLHWTLHTLTTQSANLISSFDSNMAQAVAAHPYGILYPALGTALWASQYAAGKAAGIKFITCCSTDPVVSGNSGLVYNIGNAAQSGKVGVAMAEMDVAASSNGAPHVVYWNDGAYAILGAVEPVLAHTLSHIAPHSSLATLAYNYASPSTQIQAMVSYLQAHSNINEVDLSTDGLAAGLPEALTAAGLQHRVQIIGEGGTITNGQYIYDGQQYGTTSFDFVGYFGYMMNALAQASVGMKITPSVSTPTWVYVKSNVPPMMLAGTGVFPIEANAYSFFAGLWK